MLKNGQLWGLEILVGGLAVGLGLGSTWADSADREGPWVNHSTGPTCRIPER